MLLNDNKSILVIDNDEIITRNLREYFSSNGYNVSTVADDKELLSKVQQLQSSVIILDFHLKSNNALNLLNELVKLENTPIIIVTISNPSVDIIISAYRKGAFDVIVKPFDMHELSDIVKKAFKKYSMNVYLQNNSKNMEKYRKYFNGKGISFEEEVSDELVL
ncbi:MAG: response regulator [Candidatus Zixiibacteriota bacterium]